MNVTRFDYNLKSSKIGQKSHKFEALMNFPPKCFKVTPRKSRPICGNTIKYENTSINIFLPLPTSNYDSYIP